MLQSKDTEWLNGYKNKTYIYAAYKRLTSYLKTHTYTESEGIEKDVPYKWKSKESQGFPGGTVVENLPANAGDTGSSPGLGGSHMPRSN